MLAAADKKHVYVMFG